jgi:hypothetical protein
LSHLELLRNVYSSRIIIFLEKSRGAAFFSRPTVLREHGGSISGSKKFYLKEISPIISIAVGGIFLEISIFFNKIINLSIQLDKG